MPKDLQTVVLKDHVFCDYCHYSIEEGPNYQLPNGEHRDSMCHSLAEVPSILDDSFEETGRLVEIRYKRIKRDLSGLSLKIKKRAEALSEF